MIASSSAPCRAESQPQEKSVTLREYASRRQIRSADLLGNDDALAIQHQGELYILRQTRAGKLILTK